MDNESSTASSIGRLGAGEAIRQAANIERHPPSKARKSSRWVASSPLLQLSLCTICPSAPGKGSGCHRLAFHGLYFLAPLPRKRTFTSLAVARRNSTTWKWQKRRRILRIQNVAVEPGKVRTLHIAILTVRVSGTTSDSTGDVRSRQSTCSPSRCHEKDTGNQRTSLSCTLSEEELRARCDSCLNVANCAGNEMPTTHKALPRPSSPRLSILDSFFLSQWVRCAH